MNKLSAKITATAAIDGALLLEDSKAGDQIIDIHTTVRDARAKLRTAAYEEGLVVREIETIHRPVGHIVMFTLHIDQPGGASDEVAARGRIVVDRH